MCIRDRPNAGEIASLRIARGSRSFRRLTESIGNVESGDQRRPECERQRLPGRRLCGGISVEFERVRKAVDVRSAEPYTQAPKCLGCAKVVLKHRGLLVVRP